MSTINTSVALYTPNMPTVVLPPEIKLFTAINKQATLPNVNVSVLDMNIHIVNLEDLNFQVEYNFHFKDKKGQGKITEKTIHGIYDNYEEAETQLSYLYSCRLLQHAKAVNNEFINIVSKMEKTLNKYNLLIDTNEDVIDE